MFDLVLTQYPRSISRPGTLHRPGTSAFDERFISVQYKRAVIRRLQYAMEKARHKHTTAESRYKKDFSQMVRIRIEVRMGGQAYISPPTWKVQPPKNKTTDRLNGCGCSLD